jgi:hypothetical protein
MMECSNWAHKVGQERILAIRITRKGWEEALSVAVLSTPLPGVYQSVGDWREQLDQAAVVLQWDPERSIQGKSLPQKSIQVGLSRHIISRYVQEWTVEIQDVTPLAHKLYQLLQAGEASRVHRQLPRERVYPTPPSIARRLGMPIR